MLPSASSKRLAPSAHTRLRKSQVALVAVLFAALVTIWTKQVTEEPIKGDGVFIVVVAVNLLHHGAFSREADNPDLLTMYREPLPVFATAGATALTDMAFGPAHPSAYETGPRARWLKLQNVLWLALLCGAAFAITFRITRSVAFAALTGVLSYAVFLYPALRYSGVDSLGTEISAAALLMLASSSYALAATQGKRAAFCAAGVLFGVLALIKASTLYIALVLAVLLLAFSLVRRTRPFEAVVSNTFVFIASMAVIVAPWMVRNWIQFDTFALAERGGLALNHRALFNDVNAVEYRGLFYVWAPSPLRDFTGRLLGFTSEDLRAGGRLSRLDARVLAPENRAAVRAGRPQDATSIMAQSNAELARIRQAFIAQGYGQRAWVAADTHLRKRAVERMLNNPRGMLAVSLATAWRGGVLLLPLFAVAFVFAWRARRPDLFAFCLPAFGFTVFYILFSHFEPRYGAPMTPIALLACVVVLHRYFSALRDRLGARQAVFAAAHERKVPMRGALP